MKKQNLLRVLGATIGQATAGITLAACRMAADSEIWENQYDAPESWFAVERDMLKAVTDMNEAVEKMADFFNNYKGEDVPAVYASTALKCYYTSADYYLREAAFHCDMEREYKEFDEGLRRFCMYIDKQIDAERGDSDAFPCLH